MGLGCLKLPMTRGVWGNVNHGVILPDGINIGVEGKVNGGDAGFNYGYVVSNNSGNTSNYGGSFRAEGTGINNIGVWASATGATTNWAGFFSGDVRVTGYFDNSSDIKLKENVQDINNSLDIISQLQPKIFNYRINDYPSMNLPVGLQYGLIAQEVEPIIPEVVHVDSNGYYSIDYGRIVPVLVEAVKEQQTQIDSMQQIINSYESRFDQIEAQLASCCDNNDKSFNTDDGTTDIEVVPANAKPGDLNKLYQNNPNPFRQVTQFKYHLGIQGFVELEIRDAFGRLVTTLINQNQTNGTYSVNWDSAGVAPGVYYYSLKVNNEVLIKKAVKLR